jgi:transcriptional regulator with XRE-family HTH domain
LPPVVAKTSSNENEIGLRVRARREQLALTRRALDDGRISSSYVARIEDGSRTPSLEILVVLAELLDTTALYLLTGSESETCLVCRRHEARRRRSRNGGSR